MKTSENSLDSSVPSLCLGSRLLMTTRWTVDSSSPPTPPDTPDDRINHFNSRWRRRRGENISDVRRRYLVVSLWVGLRVAASGCSAAVSCCLWRVRVWHGDHGAVLTHLSLLCYLIDAWGTQERKGRYFKHTVFSLCKAGTTRRL